jgi:hypothetical protein
VQIVAAYPQADTIHLVMDNLSSHSRKALVDGHRHAARPAFHPRKPQAPFPTAAFHTQDRFGEKIGGLLWDRFTVHYTPKHGSWLNQAEIEISLYSRRCLGRRRIPSLDQLQQETAEWNRKVNLGKVLINWQFTRTKARHKFGYKKNQITRSKT